MSPALADLLAEEAVLYERTERVPASNECIACGRKSFVVGFSAKYSLRSQMVRWLKQFAPRTPVVVLLANEDERFPEADCATLSEDPATWLATVAGCLRPVD